ncbi:hypothetical protein C8J57DRAFT_1083583, partial [Mycena rebaudengoi]
TFNLGPGTCCEGHLDSGNNASGICAITSVGNFDHTRSGHLVLEEFKLVIEFPSSSTALIPSAVGLPHALNMPLQPGEEQFSFTQYAVGGLFRWVEYRHMLEEAFKNSDKAVWAATTSDGACAVRVAARITRFSLYDELDADCKTVFPQ